MSPSTVHRTIRLGIAAAIAVMPLTTSAQEPTQTFFAISPQPAKEPEVWKLTVHAKAVASPALWNSLSMTPSEQTPGNAAPLYLLAASQVERVKPSPLNEADLIKKGLPAPEDVENLQDYYLGGVPFDRLASDVAIADANAMLGAYDSAFQSFDAATAREDCSWNLPIRELGFNTSFEHLSSMRRLANIVATRVRVDIAAGEYLPATRKLRGLFHLGQNLSNEGMLIQSLVGISVGALGVKRVQEFVQRPDAPNMYWSIATLPRPFIDIRQAIEWERAGFLATFPQLKNAANGTFTADDWANFLETVPRFGTGQAPAPQRSAGQTVGAAVAGAMIHPEAKRYLIAKGINEAEVNAMPAPAVLGRYVAMQYQTIYDELSKWSALPFWQATQGMQNAERNLGVGVGGTTPPANNVVTALLMTAVPSLSRAAYAPANLDRQLGMLQTVEALRHYAATHEGKLPANLDELKDTPAPIDPMTGKVFMYTVEGSVVKLDSPPGMPGGRGLQVEVTFAK